MLDPSSGDVRFSQAGIVIIGTLLSALAGAVHFLFRSLIAAKDLQNAALVKEREALNFALTRERDGYRSMLMSALTDLETVVNRARVARGEPPTVRIAPVVPESCSPPSRAQVVAADAATLRALLTSYSLDLGLPAREAGDHDLLGDMPPVLPGGTAAEAAPDPGPPR